MSIYPVSVAPAQAANSAPTTSGANTTAADYTSMFMRLLSTELQSQDPTQTMDPTTMVTQMVQINQLNDLSGIYSLLQGASVPSSAANRAINSPTNTAHSVPGGN